MSTAHRFQTPFFLGIFAGVLILVLAVFEPFFTALVLAGGFAVVLKPIHRRISGWLKGRDGIAALLTLLLAALFIFGPVAGVIAQLIREARELYVLLSQDDWSVLQGLVVDAQLLAQRVVPEYTFDVKGMIRPALSWVADHAGSFFSGTLQTVLGLVVTFLGTFYLLRDGKHIKQRLIQLSPLADGYDIAIMDRLLVAVRSVLRGSLLIALIQGTLTGLGFAIFGVPNATLWGTLAAICALVPGVGTALVLIPGVVYLYLTGQMWASIGLLAWAMLAVGLIDNLLGPSLVGKGTNLPAFLVLLSVIGGISLFGPIGFFLGPLVLSLFFALIDIYEMMFSAKRNLTKSQISAKKGA